MAFCVIVDMENTGQLCVENGVYAFADDQTARLWQVDVLVTSGLATKAEGGWVYDGDLIDNSDDLIDAFQMDLGMFSYFHTRRLFDQRPVHDEPTI